MNKHRGIIVALDVEDLSAARALAEQLTDCASAFKIGKQLFTRYGPEAVRCVTERGGRVFLDLKYHDIPATVAKASREAARLGVFMFTMHTFGGVSMMRQAAEALKDAEPSGSRPLALGVTVLTSLSATDLKALGIERSVEDTVVRLAELSQRAGLDGVVASPREVALIRKACGKDFVVVTPGIRPRATAADDQKRTMTPAAAFEAGANYLVIGRPITAAPDPRAAAEDILSDLH